MDAPHYSISAVAGMQYRPDWPKVQGRIRDKAVLKLEAEPGNKHDPFAVKVFFEGTHIGYLPRHDSERVSKLLKRGIRVEATVSYRPAMRLRLAWREHDADPDDWLR